MTIADEARTASERHYVALRSTILVARGEVVRDYSAGYIAGASRKIEVTEADVDRVAAAIAKAADADYWVDEIADWEGSEQWVREAHPDNHPHSAYEDRADFRKQARAALDAALGGDPDDR